MLCKKKKKKPPRVLREQKKKIKLYCITREKCGESVLNVRPRLAACPIVPPFSLLAQKIAVIKLSCTLQHELLDAELRRCSPRHSHHHKSNCTAAGECVVTVEFRHLQMYTVTGQIYRCVLCLVSLLSASTVVPLVVPNLQLASGGAFV